MAQPDDTTKAKASNCITGNTDNQRLSQRSLKRDTVFVSLVVTPAGLVQDRRCGGVSHCMYTTNPMTGIQWQRFWKMWKQSICRLDTVWGAEDVRTASQLPGAEHLVRHILFYRHQTILSAHALCNLPQDPLA